jgi:5,10-methylenetetrahydromethanopterin reductase
MAGRVADGVFMHVGAMPQFYEYALQNVMQGAKEAGRTMKELKLLSWVICSISENHKKAISAVKYMIVGLLRFAGGMITTLPEDVTGIDSRFMVQLHDELRKIRKIANRETQVEMMNRLIPDMLVEKYAVAGTPKECRAKVEELLDKHPDAILFNVQPPSERVLQSRLISKNIVAQYR